MKRLFPLAWAGLKSRKRSTALLLSAIVLSVTFLVVMGLIGSSSLYTVDAQHKDLYGEQKAVAWGLSAAQKTQLENSPVWNEIGKITVYGAVSSTSDAVLGIGSMDEQAIRLGHIRLAAGRWPKGTGEIALEKSVYRYIGNQPYAVGDSITLEIQTVEGTPQKATYQVVGLLEDYSAVWRNTYAKYTADGTASPPTVSFLVAGQELAFSDEAMETWLFNSSSSSYSVLHDSLSEEAALQFNYSVYPQLSYYGGMSEPARDTLGIGALIGGMILVCMMVILLNGFLMSVDRRKRQLSLLRCIGATRKQAYCYLFCEAFLLLGIGLPAGIVLGIPLSVGAVKLFGAFSGSGLIYHFNGWVLLLAVLACVICVCLATLLPAIRAARTAPIAGARTIYFKRKSNSREGKWQKKPGKVCLKPFGLMMLSMRKAKGKTVLTTVTFALVIVVFNVMMLFHLVAYKPSYETANVMLSAGYVRYEYIVGPDSKADGIPIELPDLVRGQIPVECQSMDIAPMFACSVPFSQYDQYLNGYYRYDNKELGLQHWQDHGQYDYFFSEQQKYGYSDQEFLIMPEISIFDDHLLEELSTYVSDGAIDKEAINRGEEIVLCMPDYALEIQEHDNGFSASYSPLWTDPVITEDTTIFTNTNWKAGDTLTFTWVETQGGTAYEKHNKTVRIGAIVKDAPAIQGAPRKVFGMIVGEQTLANLELPYDMRYQYIYFPEDADIEQTEAEIRQFISKNYPLLKLSTATEQNLAEQQTRRTTISIMSMITVCLLALGFLGLMNTVSSRIHSRLHEIGLLRCIGMTKGQVYRMFVYEGAVFGVFASLLGTAGCFVILPKFQGNWLHTQTPLYLALSCVFCLVLAILTIFLPVHTVLKKSPTAITHSSE